MSRTFTNVLASILLVTLGIGGISLPLPALDYSDFELSSEFDGIRYEFENPSRLIAIGDLHGDADAFATIAEHTGLVDVSGKWIGDTSVLVIVGDLIGKGPYPRALLDMVFDLKKQAELAGGRVICLIGNHEIPRETLGIDWIGNEKLEYFDDFAPPPAYKESPLEMEIRRLKARAIAFSHPDSPYTIELRNRNAIVKVGDTLLFHAGPGEYLRNAPRGHIGKVNTTLRELIAAKQREIWRNLSLSGDDTDGADRATIRRLRWMNQTNTELSLWGREFGRGQYDVEQIEALLNEEGATRIVIGHVPTKTNKISYIYPELNGNRKVIKTDTSIRKSEMLSAYIVYSDGSAEPVNNISRKPTHPYAEAFRTNILKNIRNSTKPSQKDARKSPLECAINFAKKILSGRSDF